MQPFVYISQPITWLLGGQPSFVFVFNKCSITIICAHHIDTFWQYLLLMKNDESCCFILPTLCCI